MIFRAKTLGAALLVALMTTAAPASAADLIGVDVTGTLLYPDKNTNYLGQTPVTTTVGSGVEFQSGFFNAPGSIDIGANTVTFNTNFGGAYGSDGSFNGYSFDFGGRTITSFTLNPNSTFTPLSYSFSGSSVSFNVNGQTANNGVAIFDVGVSAVPEPATWAMMLVGFGAVGFSMRRKAQTRLAYATA